MKSERTSGLALQASKLLVIFAFLGVTILLFFGYRITREWQEGVVARITHQNEENADLIMKAIARDMRGAQTRMLANRDWGTPLEGGSTREMTELVITTFARYPYPESLFTWRGGHDAMNFFSRTTRLPKWAQRRNSTANYPIDLEVDPPIADQIQKGVSSSIAAERRYAVFNIDFGGVPYQVVARITYKDFLREHVESVSGFTVNLDWVRKWYFADILSEVGPSANGGPTQGVALVDEQNRVVLGSNTESPPVAQRTFQLLFMDPSDSPEELSSGLSGVRWRLRVSASRDPMLLSASRRVDITLLATIFAVILCGASLTLAYKAVLSDARLSEMRSRFVSSVTHELKTPLANIHALASTLAHQALIPSGRYREYPNLLISETNHLRRLVDNLLAYARITDVSEVYAFEPMSVAELVDDAVRSFQPQVAENGKRVQLEMPPDPPFVHVDQRAMLLALNNLIENAMRHVPNNGQIRIATSYADSVVSIEVQDDGCGISTAKLAALRASIASRSFAPCEGGGLGLAIASKVVADHRGTLTVESVLGVGTRCIIGLPAC